MKNTEMNDRFSVFLIINQNIIPFDIFQKSLINLNQIGEKILQDFIINLELSTH